MIYKKILNKSYPLIDENPAIWALRKDIQKDFRRASKEYLNFCKSKKIPNFHGVGIIICGGGKLWPSIWVAVKAIRYHKCNLPIEIWYIGDFEKNIKIMNLLSQYNVSFVDALEVNKKHPYRIFNNQDICFKNATKNATIGGFALKPYSILHSKFSKVLYIDADNTPARNPEYIFESKEFLEYGSYFFPDKPHNHLEEKFTLSKNICDVFGIDFTEQIAFDSGSIFINKDDCYKELMLTNWWNEFADYTYEIIHGDKDTFNISWRQMQKPFFISSKNPIPGFGLQQFDESGNLIFLHRCGAKWSLKENPILKRPQEEILHSFILELKQNLKKKIFL